MPATPKRSRGRPSVITPALEKEIAELLWLAFNDDQIALATGVSDRTIQKIRNSELFPQIKKAEIGKEKIFRTKIWKGGRGWQGAAWFLERKYPREFARPEIQLNVSAQTTNVTNISITAVEFKAVTQRLEKVDGKIGDWFNRRAEIAENGADSNGENLS